MLIEGIRPNHIIRTSVRRNKDYEVDFVNTDDDIHTLRTILRENENKYQIKLTLLSSISENTPLEKGWVYNQDDYELASRVFHRICDEVDDVKVHYNREAIPFSTIASKIQEAVKPISQANKDYKEEITVNVPLSNQNIPSRQIVHTAARRNKDYEVDFVNTESNNDVYTLRAFLRSNEDEYKIRLVLISSILAYPALELHWVYKNDDYELASRAFHRICDEVDDVKTHYDRSMTPISTVAAQIREAVKPISSSHQEKTNIPMLDEAAKLSGVSDWRFTIYRGQYPKTTRADEDQVQKLEGNHIEVSPKHVSFKTREKY
jgi:hypothetical protein